MHIFDISIFGLHIAPTWYGLMYAIGFIFCYHFIKKFGKLSTIELDSLLTYVFLGVILGGRIGYVLLYNRGYFVEHPWEIFAFWNWGMSFHGGFVWVLIAIFLFCKKYQKPFWEITDILAVCIPVALGLGRIGNWINNELPWYLGYSGVFAMRINGGSYFPSPLLQAFLEGIILTCIMFFCWKQFWVHKKWFLSSIFLIGYGCVRLIAELFRLPDNHIWYLLGTEWLTLGMLYTIPMIIIWILLVSWPIQNNKNINE